ncbi:Self-incomp_S1 domain-containing protein [Cephalotus follicularis]|uniref:S-protein homolog n=1 Tax=Cephalotus follicularis TaxID=3775 RepID=A0A1Q3CTW6_CEPFO|nr:Self-incomp_S1 domain-containing protein [Cephalotus follicularis]
MDLTNKNIIFYTLFIALMEVAIATSFGEEANLEEHFVISPHKTHVNVLNRLNGNFTIHCKSKDDDVGIHVIPVRQSYDLSFRVNVMGSTLFFCSVTSQRGSINFDLYNAKRDMKRCPTQCNWIVAKVGLIGLKQSKIPEIDMYISWSKSLN